MNSTQRAAVDTERRRLFRPLGHDVCAHLSKWRDHAVHGASRERGLTDEATLKCLPGEQASKKSHGRARISAIDFLFRRREHTLLSVDDERVRLGLFDLDSQSAERVHRVHAIFARKKTAQRANAVG